ncbi:hypothetical protein EV174_006162, partial [Coemansia sp. RSA 2320]
MSFRKGLFSFVGIMSVAVLLRYTIVPDEDKMLRSLSPELRAEYERNKEKRREQHDAIMSQIVENSKSDKPIWDVSPSKRPDSGGAKGSSNKKQKKVLLGMSGNKGVNIKSESEKAGEAPTPQNTPIFSAPIAAAAAAASGEEDAL